MIAMLAASASGILVSTSRPVTRPLLNAPMRASGAVCSLPSGWKEYTDKESGAPYFYNAATGTTQWEKPGGADAWASTGGDATRSLTPGCSWRVKLELTDGKGNSVPISGSVKFAEDEGFEPPQGFLLVEQSVPEGALSLGQQPTRWRLSEDPEDKGDSLWIWGLFSEPLYPFILFELVLAEPVEVAPGVTVPAGPLCCQVDHRRKDGGVQLGEGTLTYKVTEKLAADLVGLSEVSYDEPIPCGKITFLDTIDSISKSYV